jgi:hypothetical protein
MRERRHVKVRVYAFTPTESTLRSLSIGRMKGRVNVSSFFVPREERFAALGEGLLPR